MALSDRSTVVRGTPSRSSRSTPRRTSGAHAPARSADGLRSTDAHRSPRRNRLDERTALAIAAASGIAASVAGARPTGSTAVDVVIVGCAVAFVTWAAATAPWWAVAAAAAVAAIIAVDALLTTVAALAFVAGLWIGVRRRDLGALRAIVVAVALNVLIRSELDDAFGVSALIGVAVAVVIAVVGLRRRRRRVRRIGWSIVAAVGVTAGVAVIAFGVSAATARARLLDGNRRAQEGIAALGDGDFELAAEQFAAAAAAFEGADEDLSRPWVRAAALVPVVAQHGEAIEELAARAATSSRDVAAALADVDPERLRLTDGRIDLAAFETFTAPLTVVQRTLTELRTTIDDVDSPWLIEPIGGRLGALARDLLDNEESLDNAITATELVPEMLGRDGPRRYLIAFTTPAEARGLGGFMGNFADFVADSGQLTMTRFGRTTELNLGGENPLGRAVTAPQEWLDQWGRYGFVTGTSGTTSSVPWSNVTMSPHFPSTATVMAELYPQSGGARIDGVFAMDPYVLAAFVELTGPIDVPSTGASLDADTLVPFLLAEQYTIDDGAGRVDLLEDVARSTLDRVLGGSLPAPTELAAVLGSLARQGRLVAWSPDPGEQALFERVGMSGGLPDLDGGDGVAVVVNNAAANKMDVYLERDVRYRATVDAVTGETTGTLLVTLTNSAPSVGLPDVVIGNAVGDPSGTSRELVSIYTALPVVSASLDGSPLPIETGREHGWVTSRAAVTIPSAGSRTIELEVAGSLDVRDGYSLATRPQPLVAPERHDIAVVSTDGDALATLDEVATTPRRTGGGES
jgi:hypothetical protein